MLGIKKTSQVYNEAHAGTYTMMRMKGDSVVNHALDSRLERKLGWTRKSSTIVLTNKSTTEKEVLINKAKIEANKSIKEETLALWNKTVEKLTLQGDFSNLLIKEENQVG